MRPTLRATRGHVRPWIVAAALLASSPFGVARAADDDPASRHVYSTGGVHNDKDCVPASKCIYRRKPGEPTNGTVRPCAADVDGDGRFDLFTANYGPNGLFLNRGAGRFEDASAAWGIAIDSRYDTCAFADIDHDGRLDLYVNGVLVARGAVDVASEPVWQRRR